MPRPVSYSKEYDRVRMQLTPGEKILVGEAEDRIANDPTPTLPGRFEDHGYIYETAAQDFVIEYLTQVSGWISFERLIDLRNPDL